jgi:hypothetical protein
MTRRASVSASLPGDSARLAYETNEELVSEAVGDLRARPGVAAAHQTFGHRKHCTKPK